MAKQKLVEVDEAVDAGDWDSVHPTALRIIEVAADRVDADGALALRLDHIADALGVSAPAIYRYFAGRDELLDAVDAYRLDRSAVPGTAMLADVMDQASSPDEFRALIRPLFEAQMSPGYVDVLMLRTEIVGATRARPVLMTRVRRIVQRWHNELVDTLSEAERRGLIEPRVPVAVAADLSRALFWGQLQLYLDDPDYDTSAIAKETADLAESLLFGGGTTT